MLYFIALLLLCTQAAYASNPPTQTRAIVPTTTRQPVNPTPQKIIDPKKLVEDLNSTHNKQSPLSCLIDIAHCLPQTVVKERIECLMQAGARLDVTVGAYQETIENLITKKVNQARTESEKSMYTMIQTLCAQERKKRQETHCPN